MCKNCKNKTVGCSKFCDRSRNEFREHIEELKLQIRVRQREAEIIRMMKGRK